MLADEVVRLQSLPVPGRPPHFTDLSLPVTDHSLPVPDLSLPFLDLSPPFTDHSLPLIDLSLPFISGPTPIALCGLRCRDRRFDRPVPVKTLACVFHYRCVVCPTAFALCVHCQSCLTTSPLPCGRPASQGAAESTQRVEDRERVHQDGPSGGGRQVAGGQGKQAARLRARRRERQTAGRAAGRGARARARTGDIPAARGQIRPATPAGAHGHEGGERRTRGRRGPATGGRIRGCALFARGGCGQALRW